MYHPDSAKTVPVQNAVLYKKKVFQYCCRFVTITGCKKTKNDTEILLLGNFKIITPTNNKYCAGW